MGLFSFFSGKNSLAALSDLDNSRLSDLGLSRRDLFEARHINRKVVGNFLTSRRAERAYFWLK